MNRLIDLGDTHDFHPLINDIIKTLTVLLVTEIMGYFFNHEDLLDKVFIRILVYSLIGHVVFYLVIDKLVGSGPTCCHINFAKKQTKTNKNNMNN